MIDNQYIILFFNILNIKKLIYIYYFIDANDNNIIIIMNNFYIYKYIKYKNKYKNF
jgi:hypothetical protein